MGPISIRSLALIAAVTVALPPLHANSGPCRAPNRSMSWIRPERIGPTGLLPLLWKTIAKRVRLSLTISSNTMSASLKPVCGRAPGALSIFTTSAGLRMRRSGSGMPVSGHTGSGSWRTGRFVPCGAAVGGTGTAVVVDAGGAVVLVVDADVVSDPAAAAVVVGPVVVSPLVSPLASPPPLHALMRATAATRAQVVVRRRGRRRRGVIEVLRVSGPLGN